MPLPFICLAYLPFLYATLIAACSDSYKYVNCTAHCLVPDFSANFFPELSHTYYFEHFHDIHSTAMENLASTTDTQTPKMKPSPKSLRILCFGDSLTAGYSKFGYFHYPYAKQIREKLKEGLPSTDATVDVAGLSGDQVIVGQYLRRMKGVCAKAEDAPYDWIIVLGGTNDLAWSERADSIYEGLSS